MLIDHGMDSITAVINTMLIAQMVQAGRMDFGLMV
jgi:hypothetical protein